MREEPATDEVLHAKPDPSDTFGFMPNGALTREDYLKLMEHRDRNLNDGYIQRRRGPGSTTTPLNTTMGEFL